jgi:hypothetical protein
MLIVYECKLHGQQMTDDLAFRWGRRCSKDERSGLSLESLNMAVLGANYSGVQPSAACFFQRRSWHIID